MPPPSIYIHMRVKIVMSGSEITRAQILSDVFAISDTNTIIPAVMRYFIIINSMI